MGGPNAVAGWGLLTLLVISNGISVGKLVVDPYLFTPVLFATICTGMGIYAFNAYFDRDADKINKPRRPIPSGRITPQNALRYSIVLMIIGWVTSIVMSIIIGEYLMFILWSLFTILGIAYSLPPIKLKARHICGNLCFAAFAMLAFFIGMIMSPSWELISGYGVGMLALMISIYMIGFAGSLTMKDFYDYEGDKANGDITIIVKFGRIGGAFVAIGLMAVPTIFMLITSPPTNIYEFLVEQWSFFLNVIIFGVYIGLEYAVAGHHASDAYARVLYYYIVLRAAYGFLSGPLGISGLLSEQLQNILFLSIYVVVATTVVFLSIRRGKDVLRI